MPKQNKFYVATKSIEVTQDGMEYEIPAGQIVAHFNGAIDDSIDAETEVPISMRDQNDKDSFVGMPIASLKEITI